MPRGFRQQDVYRAKEAFFYGDNQKVEAGELVHGGHDVIASYPELFELVEPSERFQAPDVEQATAAPGEKRR